MVERKTFESLYVDLRKKEFLLNGEPMEMITGLDLKFDNGEWSLLVTHDERYEQAVRDIGVKSTNEILCQQLDLLAERAKGADDKELPALTNAMILICSTLRNNVALE